MDYFRELKNLYRQQAQAEDETNFNYIQRRKLSNARLNRVQVNLDTIEQELIESIDDEELKAYLIKICEQDNENFKTAFLEELTKDDKRYKADEIIIMDAEIEEQGFLPF